MGASISSNVFRGKIFDEGVWRDHGIQTLRHQGRLHDVPPSIAASRFGCCCLSSPIPNFSPYVHIWILPTDVLWRHHPWIYLHTFIQLLPNDYRWPNLPDKILPLRILSHRNQLMNNFACVRQTSSKTWKNGKSTMFRRDHTTPTPRTFLIGDTWLTGWVM